MRASRLLVPAASAAILFVAAEAAAMPKEVTCNPVRDSSGAPVRTADHYVVQHAGSSACVPSAEQSAPAEKRWSLAPHAFLVFFTHDSTRLDPSAESNARTAALTAGPHGRVTVVGHADRSGPEAYNDGLSERRAKAVADILLRSGVSADRLTVRFEGERKPAVPTEDGVREGANRRAEIVVVLGR
jgi:outer membrane protein OmpA-like peptidoglycan-associated protein